jgi:hypothetical protein
MHHLENVSYRLLERMCRSEASWSSHEVRRVLENMAREYEVMADCGWTAKVPGKAPDSLNDPVI